LRNRYRNRRGFTLVELMIVTVVISVLAAIVVPQTFAVRDRAYRSTMKLDLKNLAKSQEAYYVDNQAYTPDLASLTLGFRASANVTVSIESANATEWKGQATHSGTASTCTTRRDHVRSTTVASPSLPPRSTPRSFNALISA
jgi:prepilin-type N-terminal cleavage/methylation domain-containing protein